MLDCLSDEVLVVCFAPLTAAELCSVAAVARRYRRVAGMDALWRPLVLERWGLPPLLAAAAARRAGCYRALYADEALTNKRVAPWRVPSSHTLGAFGAEAAFSASECDGAAVLSPSTPGTAPVAPLALLFLIDGSGSVTDDDFEACRGAALQFAAAAPPGSLVGVCQFSAYVRVEVPFAGTLLEGDDESEGDSGDESGSDDSEQRAPRPAVAPPFDLDAFSAAVRGIQRINGATYISTALRKAAAMFAAPECNAARRCLVLLTDGRISADEAAAAEAEATAQAAAPHYVELYALGVGRGVDCDTLKRIVAPGTPPDRAAERYLALHTLDESEW